MSAGVVAPPGRFAPLKQAELRRFNPAQPRGAHGEFGGISYETGRMPTDQLPVHHHLAIRPYPQSALVEDVRRRGVQKPIAIRHNSGGAFIANGRHRAAAAREAGVEDVPVIIQHSEGVNPRALRVRGRVPASERDFQAAYLADK